MAFPVLFVNAVLNSDISVAELINFQTAAAKVEIRIVFVGGNNGSFRRNISAVNSSAFCKGNMSRFAEAAVFDESHTA